MSSRRGLASVGKRSRNAWTIAAVSSTDDEYWAAVRVSDHYGKMNVKALHAAGWHDIFSGGSIRRSAKASLRKVLLRRA